MSQVTATSQNTQNTPSGTVIPPHTPRRRPGARRWIVLLLLLVLTPFAYRGLRHEVSQWFLAFAYEAALEGDVQVAAAYADKAIAWSPDNSDAYFRRSEYALRQGNAASTLQWCDKLVSLHRKRVARATSVTIEYEQFSLAYALNHSAYCHALAEEDLDKALEQIEESVGLLGNALTVQVRDTLAYLYFLHGRHAEALEQAEIVLQEFESHHYPQRRAALATWASEVMDRRWIEYQQQQLRAEHAIYYQHRGLIYRAVGREEEAAADLAKAQQLGFDPQHGVW